MRERDQADLVFVRREPRWDLVKNRVGHTLEGLSESEKEQLIADLKDRHGDLRVREE